MKIIVTISEASDVLGVSITTLRRWEAGGKLAALHTAGGHRRYDLAKLKFEVIADLGSGMNHRKICLKPNNTQATYFARAANSTPLKKNNSRG